MSQWVNSLEQRTLFAVTIPTSLATTYAAVVGAYPAIRVDAITVVATLKSKTAAIGADLRAVPKSKTNTGLEKSLKGIGAVLETEVRAGVAKYLLKAPGTFKKVEISEATYDARPTAANAKRQTAALASAYKVLGVLDTLVEGFSEGVEGEFGSVTSMISADNPSATTLNADIQAAQSVLTAESNTATADLTTAQDADAALIGIQLNGA